MKKEVKRDIIASVVGMLMVATLSIVPISSKMGMNIVYTKAATLIVVVFMVGCFVTMIGIVPLLDDLFTKTAQSKLEKSTNPWIQAPKVEVKKEDGEIPDVWDNRVLTGDIR